MKVLEELRSVFRRYERIETAVLFGSRARGDNTERSDYDVAVYGTLSDREKISLRYFCDEELPTLHKIDLIFMCEPHTQKFIDSIEKEKVIFYDKNSKQI